MVGIQPKEIAGILPTDDAVRCFVPATIRTEPVRWEILYNLTMPHRLHIDLPIIVSCHQGLYLAEPVGWPQMAVLAARQEQAISQAKTAVIKSVKSFVAKEFVECLVRGTPVWEILDVEFQPEAHDVFWRANRTIPFPVLRWRIEPALDVAIVPALQLRVVASPHTNLTQLVREQIRSTVRRLDRWSLRGIALHEKAVSYELNSSRLSIELRTPSEQARSERGQSQYASPTLRKVATRLDPRRLKIATGRDEELTRMVELLGWAGSELGRGGSAAGVQRRQQSVLLVGPSGVGKTAIFQTWYRQYCERYRAAGQTPKKCYFSDGSRLISGQSGFGGWQEQCLEMIEDARRVGGLLHLGNANELCESGKAWGSGGVGALLAPAIFEGKIQVVLECTPEELARLQRTEPRLIGGLTKLEIHEPDPETTRRILLDAAANWKPIDISATIAARAKQKRHRAERRAGIEPTTIKQKAETARTETASQPLPRVDPEALECLDRLHRRFPTSSASPGRVLTFFSSVMSELVASAQHQPLDVACVTDAFSRQTGLPTFLVDSQSPPDLTAITSQLSTTVLGQPGVIEVMVDLIAVLATDLSRGDRPLASLLLIGPTGVGKTETAKALSQLMYSDVARLVRIDMAEYSDPIAAMRLVGTTSEPDGVLTSAVQAQPFSLILLDEFEKADRSVFDLLLQVLGEGRLTDRRGRVADFRNSIIMMTSNLGVEDYRDVPLGLAAGASNAQSLIEDPGSFARLETHFRRKVREFLRPEMTNRIDRILAYHPLAMETIELLTRRQINSLRQRDGLREHDGVWQVDDDVIESIARDAYQPQYGARPLARQIQRELLVPLAEIIPKMRTRALDLQISRPNGRTQISCTPAVDSKGLFARTVIVAGREKASGLGFVDNEFSGGTETQRGKVISTADLIAKVSRLRRLSQSFVACELMRDANTQYTLLCRTIKRDLKKQGNRLARERIRYGEQARLRDRLLVKIREGEELKKHAEELEAEVLSTVYATGGLEAELVQSRASELEDTLFLMLCDLSESEQANRDRITLIVSGPDLNTAKPLLTAYHHWGSTNQRNVQIHAIIRRDHRNDTDKVLDVAGWNRTPAFRIATEDAQPVSANISLESIGWRNELEGRTSKSPPDTKAVSKPTPQLAAYRMEANGGLKVVASESVALMMTFRGSGVATLLGGEAGVHSFQTSLADRNGSISVFVQRHDALPIEYLAPQWLARADFQYNGKPRRRYDMKLGLVVDLHDESSLLSDERQDSIKMDRAGQWLAEMIESAHRARMWSHLADDWPTEEELPF